MTDIIVFKKINLARIEGGSRIAHTATTDNLSQIIFLEHYIFCLFLNYAFGHRGDFLAAQYISPIQA